MLGAMSLVRDAVTETSRAVVLVEGISDKVALEALATRRGRDLVAENVAVVPIGGAQAIGRFLKVYVHEGWSARLAGLCDAGEERDFRLALEGTGFGQDLRRADMERLGFYVCEADLETSWFAVSGPTWWKKSWPRMGSWFHSGRKETARASSTGHRGTAPWLPQ